MDFSLLSKYDDLLCDIFLDDLHLWFKTIKMNTNHRKANISSSIILDLIKRHVVDSGKPSDAVADLIKLDFFQQYLKGKPQKDIYEFGQHMKRYLYMYMPNAGYEISDTSRYGAGAIEACVIATKSWKAGDQLSLCTGMIACLNPTEDAELKQSNRDFSVMYSTRKGCSCLFLGPARFMNHDCNSNCKFMSLGQNAITFKIVKDISCGEEMTVFYGAHYFGENNCECRCVTCEQRSEGYFAPKLCEDGGSMTSSNKENKGSEETRRRSGRKRKQASYDAFFLQPQKVKSKTNTLVTTPVPSKKSPVMDVDLIYQEPSSSTQIGDRLDVSQTLSCTPMSTLCDTRDADINERSQKGDNVTENNVPGRCVHQISQTGHNIEWCDVNVDFGDENDAISGAATKYTNQKNECGHDGASSHAIYGNDSIEGLPHYISLDDADHIRETARDTEDEFDDFMDDLSDLSSLGSCEWECLESDLEITDRMTSPPHCKTCKRGLSSTVLSDKSNRCRRCQRHFTLFNIDWPTRKLRKTRKQRAQYAKVDIVQPVAMTMDEEKMKEQSFPRDDGQPTDDRSVLLWADVNESGKLGQPSRDLLHENPAHNELAVEPMLPFRPHITNDHLIAHKPTPPPPQHNSFNLTYINSTPSGLL